MLNTYIRIDVVETRPSIFEYIIRIYEPTQRFEKNLAYSDNLHHRDIGRFGLVRFQFISADAQRCVVDFRGVVVWGFNALARGMAG